MEKKKLLLVAISVGVFLALTIGAAILVFTPKNTYLPFETVASNSSSETDTFIPQSTYQSLTAVSEQQPSSIDAVDLVRNPGGVPGLVTPPESSSEAGRSAENVISITQPTTAAVPNTAPTGRAANQSAPATASGPAQTSAAPSQTTTAPAPTQTASRPAQTSAAPTQTTSAPAQTASAPTQTTSTPAQTASTPAQIQTIPVASTASQATQARIYDDFWVQTGAFSTMASAEEVKESLASKGITSIIENGNVNGRNLFRVRVGPYTSQNEANYWLALIKSIDGFEDSQVRQSQNLR